MRDRLLELDDDDAVTAAPAEGVEAVAFRVAALMVETTDEVSQECDEVLGGDGDEEWLDEMEVKEFESKAVMEGRRGLGERGVVWGEEDEGEGL